MENYFIKLWGTPTLRENGRSLPLNEILGKQLTELLCYFLIHRGELVSHERLIELFWPESVNPQNALKFAVHRLRKLTQPYAETKEQEWIATGKHGYLFSLQAPVETDLFQLSSLTPELLAKQPGQIEALIRGELMEGYSSMWILPIREFWKEKVKTLVQETAGILDQTGQAEAALQLTQSALALDPYSDELNYRYLSELVKAKEYNRALKHYDQISEQFYHEFGVEFEGRSKSLIYFLSSDREPSHSIQELVEEMNASEDECAFYCEQPVFRKLYQARMRESKRLDINSYLLVLDVQSDSAELGTRATDALIQIVKTQLRSCDIFTRTANCQLAVMLMIKAASDVHKVVSRLSQRLNRKYPTNQVRVYYHAQKIEQNGSQPAAN